MIKLELTRDELSILKNALYFIRDMPTAYEDLLGIEPVYNEDGEQLEEGDDGWIQDPFSALSDKVNNLCSSAI